jgi:transcriptional regulator with XRE-family HTH domain
MSRQTHPICKQIRDLRTAARLSLTEAEALTGISAVVLGSYERGDRIPPLTKIEKILGSYGYRLAAVPVDFDAVRLPSDMATELRAIATQIEKEKQRHDVPGVSQRPSLIL